MTQDPTTPTTPRFFEAVPMESLESGSKETCFLIDGNWYALRPLPLVSEISDEDLKELWQDWMRGKIKPSGDGALMDGMKIVRSRLAPSIALLKSRVSELEETVLAQNKQIVELGKEKESLNGKLEIVQDQLDACLLDIKDEKEKSRENEMNFCKWVGTSYYRVSGWKWRQIKDENDTTEYSLEEIRDKYDLYLTSLTDKPGK